MLVLYSYACRFMVESYFLTVLVNWIEQISVARWRRFMARYIGLHLNDLRMSKRFFI